MPFGQVVMGPPGCGKTTYCHGMELYMLGTGRQVAVVNLDPANDSLPYTPAIDINDLVCLEQVMEELKLGPNGGLIYCIDYLEKNLDWLQEKMEPLKKANCYFMLDLPGQVDANCYFMFDLPGQVELFTTHSALRSIVDTMTNVWNLRLAAVVLIDAHLYISALLLSLGTMLHLEMPHINVLSKVDLLRQYGQLDFQLDFYTEVQDLGYLVAIMERGPLKQGSHFAKKYRKLSEGLCGVVEEYGLVSYIPLAIQDQRSVKSVLEQADKANGFVMANLASKSPYPEFVYGYTSQNETDALMSYQEKYVDGDAENAAAVQPKDDSLQIIERLIGQVENTSITQ
eukprot:gene15014-21083_t